MVERDPLILNKIR